MEKHYPRGRRLSALEKNELKRRALEMVLVLFYVEDLKQFVVSSIQATDRVRGHASSGRLPPGTKRLYEKAWAVLVTAGVLTKDESDEIQRLIDYRNFVAHQTHALTGDIGRLSSTGLGGDTWRYESDALRRVQFFRDKVFSGMRPGFVLSLSFRGLLFNAAEKTYLEELKILERKIRRQAVPVVTEVEEANSTISRLRQSGLLAKLAPGDPDQINRSGQLTEIGIKCCRSLFGAGASPFVVAHLMRLSLRAATRQYEAWQTAVERSGATDV